MDAPRLWNVARWGGLGLLATFLLLVGIEMFAMAGGLAFVVLAWAVLPIAFWTFAKWARTRTAGMRADTARGAKARLGLRLFGALMFAIALAFVLFADLADGVFLASLTGFFFALTWLPWELLFLGAPAGGTTDPDEIG